MSMNRELNSRLFTQREEQLAHVEYKDEFGFYNTVVQGNVEEIKKAFVSPDYVGIYDEPRYGRLSKDSLRNMRYHFVVSVSLITRLCVEHGLERELAYTLSDLYISKMDILQKAGQIIELHNEMLLDFTAKMADIPKTSIYSIQVVRAIEYIYKHRNERLTVESVAAALGVNRSYMSALFAKETGRSMSGFIRSEKIKAAANMLKFSDYSYAEVAEYFGFASQSHFIQCFRREIGVTPREYRKRYWSSGMEM